LGHHGDLLAVIALVVVKRAESSPWGTFTLFMDHPHRHVDGPVSAILAAGRVLKQRDSRGGVMLR